MSTETRSGLFRIRKYALPALLLTGLSLFFLTGTHKLVSFDGLAEHYTILKNFIVARPALSVLAFGTIYVITVALSLPIASLLTLAGGALLGWKAATVIICAATLGATIVFIAARTILREFLAQRTSLFMNKLEAGFQKNAFFYLLALRLIPAAPFWVVNIVPAVLGMRLNHYVLATFIGITPGTVIYVWVARSFDILLSRGESPDLSVLREPAVIMPLFALGLLSVLPVLWQKLKARQASSNGDETMMTDLLKTDICVIGGGSGGLSVAAGAVQMGADVVLLERDRMGGDCLNTGCVPSKALLAAGKAAKGASGNPVMGVTGNAQIDFAAVKAHVAQVIADIAPHDSVERFTALGVRVIQAEARFVSAHRVAAKTADRQIEISARYFVIATGSHPWIPPIAGLENVPYYTNDTIFDLSDKPDHLLIIGGGPIGIEMAQAHRRLGCRVTILEAFAIMGHDDDELVRRLKQQLENEQIELIENTQIVRIYQQDNVVNVELADGRSLTGSHLLVAVGRRANTSRLNLGAGGIVYTDKGITTDNRLRTSQKHIFAVGDAAGRHQFTHIAAYHAGVVIKNMLFRLPAKISNDTIPWVTYTDPELAHVGLTWAEAVARHSQKNLKRVDWELTENDRARAERRTEGIVRVITTTRGRILGVSILAPHAGEMIHVWALAITKKLNISAMANTIAPYPSWSEASKRAAGAYYTNALFSARTRKLVRFLLRLTRRKD